MMEEGTMGFLSNPEPSLEERVARLEQQVAEQQAQITALEAKCALP